MQSYNTVLSLARIYQVLGFSPPCIEINALQQRERDPPSFHKLLGLIQVADATIVAANDDAHLICTQMLHRKSVSLADINKVALFMYHT